MTQKLRWIPVDLCAHALKERRTNSLLLLLCLKWEYHDRVINKPDVRKRVAKTIGVSERTLRTQIVNLKNFGWIGEDEQMIYFRSFRSINVMIRAKTQRRVEFSKLFIEKHSFQSYLLSVLIGNLTLVQHTKRKKEQWKISQRLGLEVEHTGASMQNPSSGYFPVAISAISKILQISKSRIFELKKVAEEKAFISVFHSKFITQITKEQLQLLRKENVKGSEKLFVENGKVWKKGIDCIRCNLKFRNSRRFKHMRKRTEFFWKKTEPYKTGK